MPTLSSARIAALLKAYYPSPSPVMLEQLSIYLEVLLKWNARTNLTAIRDPEEVVRRHFGESLFTALHLPEGRTLLDLGSGAGFPGLPIQIALPHLQVTLAESQGKKATFLMEVIRTLDLPTLVWSRRVESVPAERVFEIVTVRAVDNPDLALGLARQRLRTGGRVAHLASNAGSKGVLSFQIPGATNRWLQLLTAEDLVPRGTNTKVTFTS